jgi:hypothetical protein
VPTNPPNTMVRTSHAVTIRANGITVGLIQSWNVGQNRGITAVYEINQETSGEPLEKVPGNVGGLTIGVTRYDLYTKRMEAAFGTPDVMMLSDHNNPFQVREAWKFPDGTVETHVYVGCWFANVGRSYSATDNRLVMANGSLEYTRALRG